jgi:hypothetical protein
VIESKQQLIALEEINTGLIEMIWVELVVLKGDVELCMSEGLLRLKIWRKLCELIFQSGENWNMVILGFWIDKVVNALPEKGVAFVQYKSILNAEFAKEAMQNQVLESDDVNFTLF